MRWVNEATARYYRAELVQDLFVPSREAGVQQLAAIDKRRRQRGYRSAGTP